MIRIPTHRTPTHPGEMLQEEFLVPLELSQQELAKAIQVSSQKIRAIVSKRGNMTPGLALRLARFFGMSADFWMNLQLRWDLYHAQQEETDALKQIRT